MDVFVSGKRKCDDSDSVAELLQDISLSHTCKKLRQEFASTSASSEMLDAFYVNSDPSGQCVLPKVFPSNITDSQLELDLSEPLPMCTANEERAIVLYKPVNPPLFPGGPSAGSRIMLNSDILSRGNAKHSVLLTGRHDSQLLRLINSSTVPDKKDLQEETEMESDTQASNNLAVIPWVSPVSRYSSPATHANIVSQPADEISQSMDIEPMDEEQCLEMDDAQLNATPSFNNEPWQHYGVPQPQYTSVMWTH